MLSIFLWNLDRIISNWKLNKTCCWGLTRTDLCINGVSGVLWDGVSEPQPLPHGVQINTSIGIVTFSSDLQSADYAVKEMFVWRQMLGMLIKSAFLCWVSHVQGHMVTWVQAHGGHLGEVGGPAPLLALQSGHRLHTSHLPATIHQSPGQSSTFYSMAN